MENFDILQICKEKYPNGYLDHYLAMYSIHQDGLADEYLENQNNMYVGIEGVEEFQNLKNEVSSARENKDLNLFLKLAIYHEIDEIDLTYMDKLFKSIEKHKL